MTEVLFHGYVSMQTRGLFALPASLRKRYGLDQPGAQLEVTERSDGVLEVRPSLPVPVSQAWFWTPEWQAKEREADDDLAAGRFTTHDDVDAMFAALD